MSMTDKTTFCPNEEHEKLLNKYIDLQRKLDEVKKDRENVIEKLKSSLDDEKHRYFVLAGKADGLVRQVAKYKEVIRRLSETVIELTEIEPYQGE